MAAGETSEYDVLADRSAIAAGPDDDAQGSSEKGPTARARHGRASLSISRAGVGGGRGAPDRSRGRRGQDVEPIDAGRSVRRPIRPKDAASAS